MSNKNYTLIDENGLVVDENGNAVSDSNGQSVQGYQVGAIIKSGDTKRIVDDLYARSKDAKEDLEKILEGEGYIAALEALKRSITSFTSGPHIEFAKKNSFLTNPRERDEWKASNTTIEADEKRKMINLADLIELSQKFRNEFIKQLTGPVSTYLEDAFAIISSEKKMRALYSNDFVNNVIGAYDEYENIVTIYDNPSIIRTLGITKAKHSEKEAEAIILQAMSGDVVSSDHLSQFLANALSVKTAVVNSLYVCDQTTNAYLKRAKQKDKFKEIYDTCEELSQQLAALVPYGFEPTVYYFDCFSMVLTSVIRIFKSAYDIVDCFEHKSTEAPYSVMHIYENPKVSNCIRRNNLGNARGIAWDDGTYLNITIQGMVIDLRKIAHANATKVRD